MPAIDRMSDSMSASMSARRTRSALRISGVPLAALAIASIVAVPAASALPNAPAVSATVEKSALVQPARYYGHRWHRHGPGIGLGIVGGLVAGALIADSVREGSASEDDMELCASTFRSFDPDTGTYVTYGGEVRVCPYLR